MQGGDRGEGCRLPIHRGSQVEAALSCEAGDWLLKSGSDLMNLRYDAAMTSLRLSGYRATE